MNWEDIDRHPPDRKLRQFAALCFLASAALAITAILRGSPTRALVFGIVGAIVLALGMLIPAAVRPFFVALSVVTFPIGWVVSSIALALTYYCVLTPLALILRAVGRDPLHLRDRSDDRSFWQQRQEPEDERSYFQQF